MSWLTRAGLCLGLKVPLKGDAAQWRRRLETIHQALMSLQVLDNSVPAVCNTRHNPLKVTHFGRAVLPPAGISVTDYSLLSGILVLKAETSHNGRMYLALL